MKFWDWMLGSLCILWIVALLWISVPDNRAFTVLFSAGMAAWIQAIGSIGAIGVTGWALIRQERRQARQGEIDRYTLRTDQLEAITAISGRLVQMIGEVRFTPAYLNECSPYDFKDVAKALKKIPVHETRDPDVAAAILTLRREAELIGGRLHGWVDSLQNIGSSRPEVFAQVATRYRDLPCNLGEAVRAHLVLEARLNRTELKRAAAQAELDRL